eukprot:scpid98062/ scgid12920/ 
MYVHSDIHSVRVPVADSGVEGLFVRARISATPKATELVVCSVYRSPSTAVHFWDLYSQHLEVVTSSDCRLIVLGDFNTDVPHPTHTSNYHYKHLLNLCAEFHLHNVVTTPTRLAKTCLTAPHRDTTAVCVDGISDHDLVLNQFAYTVPLHAKSASPIYKVIRKPRVHEVDQDTLRVDLEGQLLSSHCATDVKEMANSLSTALTTTYDKLCPIRRVRLPSCTKPKPQPWLTPHLRYLLQQRKHFHRKVRLHPFWSIAAC